MPRFRPGALARILALPALSLVTMAALVGCGTAPSAGATSQAASQAVLAAFDDAFAADAATDDTDLEPASVASAALQPQAVEPFYVIRRRDMQRERHLLTLTVDAQQDPPVAQAEVAVTVTGTAQIWKVYPDASLPRELAGSKPIDLEGTVVLTAAWSPAGWRLTDLSSDGLHQGAYAAHVVDVSFDPDPLLIGHDDNLGFVTLDEPATTDDFLVTARGPRLRPHGVLHDDGVAPDATAGDDVYSGQVWVGPNACACTRLAFVTALNYSRTIDLSEAGGAYVEPYTDTVKPWLVTLAAGE